MSRPMVSEYLKWSVALTWRPTMAALVSSYADVCRFDLILYCDSILR